MSTKDLIAPELNKKVKKNLLNWFFVTVVMLFAGFTSAYLVMRGSTFWVHVTLPDAFKISTLLILISSIFLILAIYSVKNAKKGLLNLSLGVSLITGVLFGYYQIVGFGNLFEKGYGLSGPIIEHEGRYGNIFTMTYEGKSLSLENGEFHWKGNPISKDLKDELLAFGSALEENSSRRENKFNLDNYGTGFMLFYNVKPVTYVDNQLLVDNKPFEGEQLTEIYKFGENLANERGDFIMKGKYGEDFSIIYDGEELEYKNRTFLLRGSELSPKLQADLNGQNNNTSSFIYLFTGMHLLHWIGGIIALLVVFIRGLLNSYTKADYLGVALASRYWHFLGILWLYLYGFLIFIH